MILLVTLLPGKLTDYVLIGTLPSFALALEYHCSRMHC